MTDAQMYFAIGVPVFAIIMAVAGGMFRFSPLSARMNSFEIGNRLTRVESLLERH